MDQTDRPRLHVGSVIFVLVLAVIVGAIVLGVLQQDRSTPSRNPAPTEPSTPQETPFNEAAFEDRLWQVVAAWASKNQAIQKPVYQRFGTEHFQQTYLGKAEAPPIPDDELPAWRKQKGMSFEVNTDLSGYSGNEVDGALFIGVHTIYIEIYDDGELLHGRPIRVNGQLETTWVKTGGEWFIHELTHIE